MTRVAVAADWRYTVSQSAASVGGSMRNGFWAGVISLAIIALLLTQPHAYAAKVAVKAKHHRAAIATGKHFVEKKPVSVQIVSFPDTHWQAVKVIRGGTPAKDSTAGLVPAEKAETAEIVTFGDPNSGPVKERSRR